MRQIVLSIMKTLHWAFAVALVTLICAGATFTASCGSGGKSTTVDPNAALSGNWQITLTRHNNPDPPIIFTGFLLQSGNTVKGSVIFSIVNTLITGTPCSGVGPVTGTLNGSKLSLTVNEFGQEVTLDGSIPSDNSPLGGSFSNLAGACTAFPNTGTWTATRVMPLTGAFHGTFTSSAQFNNGTLNVTGSMVQGVNTGNSTATLSGTITEVGSPHFCSYLSIANVSGVISGTNATLDLFGPDGFQITQITAAVSPDGKSLIATYTFPTTSTECIGDGGSLALTFP